jgi:DNA (cytosine-5)-methyltransferase 1
MLKVLDLCSGIGGFSLGLEQTGFFKTIAFCENNIFCKKILKKHWDNIPIYDNIINIANDPTTIKEKFEVIVSGLPCQPYSLAGNQKGKTDNRHLWNYMFKIIKQKKPTWIIFENVPNFIPLALDDMLLDLETENYTTESFIIPACSVGAPHKRNRLWVIGRFMGDTTSNGREKINTSKKEKSIFNKSFTGRMFKSSGTNSSTHKFKLDNWFFKSSICGVSNGIPSRLDKNRIEALGNSVVPQIAFNIGLTIKTLTHGR